ncbi:MAG: branched-chain amino acid ABC transporter permease [Ancalomicrobiaceae bacterium]|nr:branched-chain amino acid ABC transporter permease [Ancalomicrobiaceae bacterium]
MEFLNLKMPMVRGGSHAKAGTDPHSPDRRIEQIVFAVALIVLVAALPSLNIGYRFLSIAITTGYTAIALYGLGLQFGQAGIMSVGHAAMLGIGAYTAAMLSNHLGIGFWAALPASIVLAAIAGGLVGLPSLRVSGQHYIIITFCFCALLVICLTNGGSFTGAATGLDVGSIPRVLGINFDKLFNYYYLVLGALAITLATTYAIMNSSYGRTLRAIRENEQLARAIGINVDMHKIGVFMASGAFAGLAGILQVYYLRHISPTLYGAFPSLYLALMVMLGGGRLLYGPLIGAIIVNFLPEVMDLNPVDSRIAYGVALLIVILLLPGGVSSGLLAIYRWVGGLLVRRGSKAGS